LKPQSAKAGVINTSWSSRIKTLDLIIWNASSFATSASASTGKVKPMVIADRKEAAMVEVWTVEAVAERFVDAARTARRLPRVAVQGYASTWPIVVLPEDAYPDPIKLYRLPPPSPKDVEQMLEVMRWVQLLELDERHLVWMRAKRYDWLEIGKRFACDRTTAWRRWKRDMQVLADRLNTQIQKSESDRF
jgi:hypothetical protein